MQANNVYPSSHEATATVTKGNMVFLPVAVQKALRVKPGKKITFRIKGTRVFVEPVPFTVESLRGSIKPIIPVTGPIDILQIIRKAKEEHAGELVNKILKQQYEQCNHSRGHVRPFFAHRFFRLSHREIQMRLLPLLLMRRLKCSQKTSVLHALELFGKDPKLDFEDAFILAFMEQKKLREVYTYDTDFDLYPQVKRIEPMNA